MTETEEPQFHSLAERIAALNRQKNFNSSPSLPVPTPGVVVPVKRAPPPPPPNRPPSKSPTPAQPLPPPILTTNGSQAHKSPGLPGRPSAIQQRPALPRRSTAASTDEVPQNSLVPPLPSRRTSQQPSPALSSRLPSSQLLSTRRNSNSSEISHVSAISTLSLTQPPSTSSLTSAGSNDTQALRKLPPTLDQANLPRLPPSRREREAQAKELAEKERSVPVKAPALPSRSSAPVVTRAGEAESRPSLPPRLPTRPAPSQAAEEDEDEVAPPLPSRRLPPPLANGFGRAPPSLPGGRPKAVDEGPPQIPLTSRPTPNGVESSERRPALPTRPSAAQSSVASCLICRDFSGPDHVAAQYPITSLPRNDVVGYLAHVLCDPFPSATDKARAIFTWCHHNIAYDVEGFFGGCIPRGQTPDQSIFSGKAVCEGYAKIYQSVAQRAGLECVVVGGHGKGYGFTPLREGERPPPRKATGHAWNAVKIDGGKWKLLDACWGAGAVGDRKYNKHFNPLMFTLSNDLFGLKHFPEDSRYFFRADGRIISWEEYIVGPAGGEPAQLYSNAHQEGISEWTFSPRAKRIPVNSGEIVRFQFSKVCEHWQSEVHGKGKPYLLMVKIFGEGGRKEDLVPLDFDSFWWWVDIPAKDLGNPGEMISLFGLDTLDGKDARGVSKQEFLSKKGRCGMSWVGIAAWDLV